MLSTTAPIGHTEGALGIEQHSGFEVEPKAQEVWLGKLVLILSSTIVIVLEMGAHWYLFSWAG